MSDHLPFFKVYPGDWRKDLGAQSLSYHARGVWHELRCIMHSSHDRGKLVQPNGVPHSMEIIARLLGLSASDSSKSINEILDSGVACRCPVSGALMCPAMVKEEKKRLACVVAGRRGGNPNLTTLKGKTVDTLESPLKRTSECEYEPETVCLPFTEEQCIEVYGAYPRKVGRPAALSAIAKSLQKIPFERLFSITAAYSNAVAGKEERFIPHPSTWFNQERFLDDPKTWNSSNKVEINHAKF